MTEQDYCPVCSAEIRYSITHDAYLCVGCGCAYSWPISPPNEPAEAAQPAVEPAEPVSDPAPEPSPDETPQ